MIDNIKLIFDKNGGIINTVEVKNFIVKKTKENGYNFNLDEPNTIQEKLLWLMVYDCSSLKTKCADKYLMREYVIETLGYDICPKLLGVYNDVDEINFNDLPDKFIMKCNHLSRANVRVDDKNTIMLPQIKDRFKLWMKTDLTMKYSCETQYYNINRKIIIEELLSDKHQLNSLYDYKFWCFNGTPMLYTINDNNGHGDIIYYDMQDNVKNFYGKNLSKVKYVKPNNFDYMITVAKKLSKKFKFVRVDFYEVNNKVYLGELTFTPGAGCFKYKTRESEVEVGNFLKL